MTNSYSTGFQTLLSTQDIVFALALQPSKRGYSGKCPSCGYPKGFTLEERHGKQLFYCHVGRCSYREIQSSLQHLGGFPSSCAKSAIGATAPNPQEKNTNTDARDCNSQLIWIWRKSEPALGSLVERYLTNRGITLTIPEGIRFLPGAPHRPSGQSYPVMLSAITDLNNQLVGLHRTFLSADGSGKAPVDQPKMMLGQSLGCAVHLDEPTKGCLAVAEGIETALTVRQVTQIPTWAALSTGGLKGLLLPPCVKKVVLFADNDAGPINPGKQAAEAAAKRWWAEGRVVELRLPPLGKDFNDLLRGEGCL